MTTIHLRNPFHGTSCTLGLPADGKVPPATVTRISTLLCGVTGCPCADSPLGTRGLQAQPDGSWVSLAWEKDGGARLENHAKNRAWYRGA